MKYAAKQFLKAKYLQHSIIRRFRKRHFINSFDISGLYCIIILNVNRIKERDCKFRKLAEILYFEIKS